MDSTSEIKEKKTRKSGTSWLRKVFGGEFLLSQQMRPWYPYIVFVLLLAAGLVINEQAANEKRQEITRLENEYKAELSRLKANNQFIPYEENQILIQKMKERGYVQDEEHNFTIHIARPVKEKKRFFLFWKKHERDTVAAKQTIEEELEERE